MTPGVTSRCSCHWSYHCMTRYFVCAPLAGLCWPCRIRTCHVLLNREPPPPRGTMTIELYDRGQASPRRAQRPGTQVSADRHPRRLPPSPLPSKQHRTASGWEELNLLRSCPRGPCSHYTTPRDPLAGVEPAPSIVLPATHLGAPWLHSFSTAALPRAFGA